MKIEGINFFPHTNKVQNSTVRQIAIKDFASTIKMREGSLRGLQLPANLNKEMIRDFAEWYFKQGKTYEEVKSYKQAISAYERSNSVAPDISKANLIDEARKKAYSRR